MTPKNKEEIKKLKIASRRAALLSIVGIAVVIISLIYAAISLNTVETQLKQKQEELSQKNKTLEKAAKELAERQQKILNLDKRIAEASGQVTTLENLRDQLLVDFGWNEKRLLQLQHGRVSLDEVLKANRERRLAASTENVERRKRITVEYFAKKVDPEKIIIESLEELGFKVKRRTPKHHGESNTIWFGKNIRNQEIRIVAYTLIRAGVKITQIQSFLNLKGKDWLINIGRGVKAYKGRPLTVEEIRDTNNFTFLRRE